MDQQIFELRRGSTPLLISLPHVGTDIPQELRARYRDAALQMEDTDWHLDALYDFAGELGAGVLQARVNRYVIDLNRPPQDAPMYSGANNTQLCPTRNFHGEPIYRDGCAPDAQEIERRRSRYWQPYHDALAAELAHQRIVHGHALLLDGHSICSRLPWLFEGKLPDLNLGTAAGASCAAGLSDALVRVLQACARYTSVVDGRFQGGYITRRYGRPHEGVHAVQLEMCWSCYMSETPPYRIDEGLAVTLRPVLREMAATMLRWGSQHG